MDAGSIKASSIKEPRSLRITLLDSVTYPPGAAKLRKRVN